MLVTPPSNPMCIGPLAFMLLKLIVSLIFGLIQILLILIHSQTQYHQYLSTECAQRCISHKPTHPGHFILLRSSGLLLSQLFMEGLEFGGKGAGIARITFKMQRAGPTTEREQSGPTIQM